jgi:subtilisin family serine protease
MSPAGNLWTRWLRRARQHAKTMKTKSRRRAQPAVEALENRTVPSIYDGSFQAIHLTDLRGDPKLGSLTGKGIGIANLDTGVYGANPDIQPNLVAWYDAVGVDEGNPSATAFDPEGHGTHTAGIEAASDPAVGVAPGASLIAVRALPTAGYDQGQVNRDTVADALNWVLQNHTQYNILVVNLSLGTQENINTPQPLFTGEPQLINELEQAGITVVASSGNGYGVYADGNLNDELGEAEPAIYATLGVANSWGAVGHYSIPPQDQQVLGGSQSDPFFTLEQAGNTDALAATSQRSTMANQVAAPGSGIYTDPSGNIELGVYSTWNQPNQLFNVISGTSMAAPMVSGVVALMQQAAITYGGQPLTPAEVRSILQATADPITDNSLPTNFRIPVVNGQLDLQAATNLPGTGRTFKRINAYAAVREVVREVQAPSSGGTGGTNADTDNTTTTANVLPSLNGSTPADTATANVGADGRVQVGPNDVDLYKVALTSTGSVDVRLGPVAGGQDFNAEVRVFDSGGNDLGHASGPASNTIELQGTLDPGTYYVGVSSAGNAQYNIADGSGAAGGQSTGDYALSVQLTNADPNGIITGAVPFEGIPNFFNGVIGSDPNPSDPNNPNDRIQIGPSDVDMFQVVAPDTGKLLVWTDTTAYGGLVGNGGQAVDTYLRVFDAQGNQLATNDDAPVSGAAPTDSSLAVPVTRGQTVYVAVSDAANSGYSPTGFTNRSAAGTGGDYDLLMDFDNGDQNGTIFDATASAVGSTVSDAVGTDGGVTIGADGSKDVDFRKYTPATDGVLDVKVTSQTAGFTPVFSLWTFSPGNATQAPSATRVADSAATQASELLLPVTGGQDYYVAVTGLGNDDFKWFARASGGGGETGHYDLATQLKSSATYNALSNDTFSAGGIQTIMAGQLVPGNVGMDGNLVAGPSDVDLYRFVAPADETIDVRTLTTAEGSADTFLRVFDAHGTELAFNDNANPSTTGSEVKLSVQAGQTYYIGVDGAGPNARSYNPVTGAGAGPSPSEGSYSLLLTAVPAPPPPLPPAAPPPVPVQGNVTALAVPVFSPPHFHGHRQVQQVFLMNASDSPLLGPLWVVVEGLPRKARLNNAAGRTPGPPRHSLPFLMVAIPQGNLDAGVVVSFMLDVSGLTARRPGFVFEVFAGQVP